MTPAPPKPEDDRREIPSPRSLSPNAPAYNHPQGVSSHENPRFIAQAGKLGMWLFLAALFMLFASSLLGYILIRIINPNSANIGQVTLPPILWGSTLAMIASSVTMHMALGRIRLGLLVPFKNMMAVTLALACLFLFLQTPGLTQLLSRHYDLASQNIHIYGLLFVLILLHAMHILGGLLPLIIATSKAWKNLYSPENHNAIIYLTMYWHFLDLVWIAMFGTFLIMR